MKKIATSMLAGLSSCHAETCPSFCDDRVSCAGDFSLTEGEIIGSTGSSMAMVFRELIFSKLWIDAVSASTSCDISTISSVPKTFFIHIGAMPTPGSTTSARRTRRPAKTF